jgi:outer membrane protein assembly factor BamA
MGFAGEAIGGRRNYQLYQAAFSTYSSLSPRQVLATKINSCYADGDVPFFDLCLLGQYQDIRGYQTGQYRDRAMLTAQAEYRLELRWRIGVVAFGGAGEVGESFGTFTGSSVLPSGGAGLRFRLTEENHVNLRADYAWGKNSSALYISIAEAF